MRIHFAIASLFLLSAGVGAFAQATPAAPTCADLHLVPAVRECTAVEALPIGNDGLVIPHETDAETEFVVRDLGKALKQRGVLIDHHVAPTIMFWRANSKAGMG